jgi:hypothetical protein
MGLLPYLRQDRGVQLAPWEPGTPALGAGIFGVVWNRPAVASRVAGLGRSVRRCRGDRLTDRTGALLIPVGALDKISRGAARRE